MGHLMIGINRKTLAIVVVLGVAALVAVNVFNVSVSTIGYIALFGFMLLMHGGHGDDTRRDEHAGHAVESTRDDNAKAIAADSNARGLASNDQAKAVKQEESHRHHGC